MELDKDFLELLHKAVDAWLKAVFEDDWDEWLKINE